MQVNIEIEHNIIFVKDMAGEVVRAYRVNRGIENRIKTDATYHGWILGGEL